MIDQCNNLATFESNASLLNLEQDFESYNALQMKEIRESAVARKRHEVDEGEESQASSMVDRPNSSKSSVR